jgi:uncharacterized protein YbbC (DUF1343 family)
MKGWKRSMKWPDTRLDWIPPSPNLPAFEHAFVYLGTVLFEGLNISEGRGTDDPFLKIGSPSTELTSTHIAKLRRSFAGVNIERITFVPESMPGKAANPDFEGQRCHGVQVKVIDPDRFDPVKLGAALLSVMIDATPNAQLNDYIQKLSGIEKAELLEQLHDQSYLETWEQAAAAFRNERQEYLLYP